jgi:hypothetical protein
MLTVLKQTEEAGGDRTGRAIVINDIRFDPATAAHIARHPGGNHTFDPQDLRRFDEDLYQTPEAYWFVVRPLAPDEVRAWLEAHDDAALLRQTFPDEDTNRLSS